MGNGGAYDGSVTITRDSLGRMIFKDSEVPSSVRLGQLQGGSSDHGSLSGLGDNDHPQYPLKAGSETISGSWLYSLGMTINNLQSSLGDLIVKGYAETYLLWCDASAGKVFVGYPPASTAGKLNVNGNVTADAFIGAGQSTFTATDNPITATNNYGYSVIRGHAIQVYRTDDSIYQGLLLLAKDRPTGEILSGDVIGGIGFAGIASNGTAYYGAEIRASATAATGASDMPVKLEFRTTPDGSGSPAARMSIGSEGTVNTLSGLFIVTPLSSAPSGPVEGQVYMNSTDKHVYAFLNGTWKQLDN